jgi:glycosyltransferase involved in cell wall biosynthesis
MKTKQKITFVIPSRDNLDFLKLSYRSIKKLQGDHDILILDDASIDGTSEWIESLEDESVIHYKNPGPNRIGIVGMFDKGIEMARTDIIFAFHADMVACHGLDTHILKHLQPGTVVCATRIEPPLHPPGPEKITLDCGSEAETFDEDKLNHHLEMEYEIVYKDKITEGIFAPWCMYRSDYLAIGGHDELFAPQSKEDSDLFNRFVLNGYQVIQSWEALVYHFTSRGSRFNKHHGGAPGKDSQEWQYTTTKNARNFIRKWGHFVKHDELMKPIIPHKYNIGFRVINCTPQILEAIEPWCDTVYVADGQISMVEEYIRKEQPNTKFNLRGRIRSLNELSQNDITLTFRAEQLNNNNINILTNLSDIITDSGEVGEFTLDIFNIEIHKLETYEHQLIKL